MDASRFMSRNWRHRRVGQPPRRTLCFSFLVRPPAPSSTVPVWSLSESRPCSWSERLERLATSTIGRDALIRHPHVFRKFSGLPKHINRHSATRIPVAADAQPFRLEQRKQSLADRDRAIFVESAVIAEAVEIELQRLRFDKETRRYVVNDQMGKIRLPGDRTQSGEFRRGKSRHIIRSGMRVCHAIKDSLVG